EPGRREVDAAPGSGFEFELEAPIFVRRGAADLAAVGADDAVDGDDLVRDRAPSRVEDPAAQDAGLGVQRPAQEQPARKSEQGRPEGMQSEAHGVNRPKSSGLRRRRYSFNSSARRPPTSSSSSCACVPGSATSEASAISIVLLSRSSPLV